MSSTSTKVLTAAAVLGAVGAAYYMYKSSSQVKTAVDEAIHRVEDELSRGKRTAAVAIQRVKAGLAHGKGNGGAGDDVSKEDNSDSVVEVTGSTGNTGLSKEGYELLKRAVSSLLEDYITTGDITEARQSVNEILSAVSKERGEVGTAFTHETVSIVAVEVVKRALNLSLDRPEREQEIMACLISSLEVYGCFTSAAITAGVDVILERLQDVLLDAPKADEVLAVILAHLILDGTLNEAYLIDHASVLLPGVCKDAPIELPGENVPPSLKLLSMASWMLYGKIPLPLQQMKSNIRLIAQSCLLTGEPLALGAMMIDLNAPHYHYEVVKKLVQVSFDGTVYDRERACYMLTQIVKQGYLKEDQMVEGYLRLYRSLPELAIDVPQSPYAVARFTAYALHEGVLPSTFPDLLRTLMQCNNNTTTTTSPAVGNALLELTRLTSDAADTTWKQETSRIGIWGVVKFTYAASELTKIAELFVKCGGGDDAMAETESVLEAAVASAETNGFGDFLPVLVSHVGVLAAKTDNPEQGKTAARLLRTLCDSGALDQAYLLLGLYRIMELLEFARPATQPGPQSHFSIVDDQDHLARLGNWLHEMLVACVEVGLVEPDVFATLPAHLASRLEDEDDDDTDDGEVNESGEGSGEGDDEGKHGRSMLITLQKFFDQSMAQLSGGEEGDGVMVEGGDGDEGNESGDDEAEGDDGDGEA